MTKKDDDPNKTLATANTTIITTEALEILLMKMNQQTSNPHIGLKFTGQNFGLWSDLVRLEIGARGREQHITGKPAPPNPGDTDYVRWEQSDDQVFLWIIQAMDSSLMSRFIHYPNSKALWDGLNTTYRSGEDSLQLFQLSVKADTFSQSNLTLQEYYYCFQEIWQEIDRRKKNPMKDHADIITWETEKQEHRLFQFVLGLDDRFALVKRDLLKENPLPRVEYAYASARQEESRLQILQGSTDWNKTKANKAKLKCSNCMKTGHEKHDCFFLNGFPEHWNKR